MVRSELFVGQKIWTNKGAQEYTIVGFAETGTDRECVYWVIVQSTRSSRPCLKKPEEVETSAPWTVTVRYPNYDRNYDYLIEDHRGINKGDHLYNIEREKVVEVVSVQMGRRSASKQFKGFKMGERV